MQVYSRISFRPADEHVSFGTNPVRGGVAEISLASHGKDIQKLFESGWNVKCEFREEMGQTHTEALLTRKETLTYHVNHVSPLSITV